MILLDVGNYFLIPLWFGHDDNAHGDESDYICHLHREMSYHHALIK